MAKRLKKNLVFLLTIVLILSSMGTAVLAEESDPSSGTNQQSESVDPNGGNNDVNDNGTNDETNPAGDNTKGDDTEGANPQGDNTEGANPQGDDTEGVNPQGDDTEGTNPQGNDTEGTNPQGNDTEGSNTKGNDTEKPDIEGVAQIDGTTYATLTKAIEAATDNDTIVLLDDVNENITINKSLTLDLGGKTLTGTGAGSVVTISGEGNTVTVKDGTVTGGNSPENGGGFAIDSATVNLENLTITGNTAVGKSINGDLGYVGGGGIFAKDAAVSMNNVTVSGNSVSDEGSTGGGVLVKRGSLTMDGCTVTDNTALNCGGGILVEHSPLSITNCKILSNKANIGAGVYFYDASTPNYPAGDRAEAGCPRTHSHSIVNSTISENEASNIGGGMYIGDGSEVAIQNSVLIENTATTGAGQGGAIVAYNTKSLKLDNVLISENEAMYGAGIFALGTAACDEATISLLGNTTVENNKASGAGGGVYLWTLSKCNLNFSAENCSVSSNTAPGGAGIFVYNGVGTAQINVELKSGAVMQGNNAQTGLGGAIYAYKANVTVEASSILYNNTAASAGDDLLLNGATFTLPKATEMSGDCKLTSDKTEITGWYHDGWYKLNASTGKYDEINRWTADTADEYTPADDDKQSISLKAAHPKMCTLTYEVKGDIPEEYTTPAALTLVCNSTYTVENAPSSVNGTKDGKEGTFSFAGWKTEDGKAITGEQTLTKNTTLYGVWTFTANKSSGTDSGSTPVPTPTPKPDTTTPDEDVDIDDSDVPLDPTPDLDDGDVEIDDSDVPLDPTPDLDDGDVEIKDSDVPLDSTPDLADDETAADNDFGPQTGDNSAMTLLITLMILSGLGLVVLLLSGKKTQKLTK